MKKKTKEFCKGHKKGIIVTGGVILTVGAGIIIGKSMTKSGSISCLDDLMKGYDDSKERAILEGFGAIYKEGYDVPFATKEVVLKFLEERERGKTYQLDILDDATSVIWISE